MELKLSTARTLEPQAWSLSEVRDITQNRLMLHVLFWAAYVTFFGLLYGSYIDDYYNAFMIELVELPFKMVLVYFNMYYLMPRFLLQRRYLEFFVYLLLLMGVITAMLQYVLMPFLIHPLFCPTTCTNDNLTFYRFIKNGVNISYVVAITALIALLKNWYRHQKAAQNLTQDKLEAELKVLKAQIHPHFLFNTLNSLYSLTLKKSDNAPEVVLKLSSLMDYMLYDANAAKVPLDKELAYIKNYVALEQMRYGTRVDVQFTESGGIAGKQIAPMLLLPFVENAFKHGVTTETENAWVRIDLKVTGKQLVLLVENCKCGVKASTSTRDIASGIGLKNLQRRLELLYDGKYELEIEDEADSYSARLEVTLD
ncbi:sensor histidine kinase [Pontibacter cellulosilyticus]|uniref:Histidine kinase n=1 Tax=Pontibacter cellulosilyticus TaxID=1720253 RepID=A0A923NAR7_9BACT|nr:histidine kinase [Pontibacter cellulosilyticus]MBC5993515.1 histidine kinase [Pontibacter cellulosilyticus]